MLRRGLALALVALAGCVTPQGGTPTSGPVGPGSARVGAMDAAMIFSTVCVDTAPDFSKASAAMQSMPFLPNAETGTYYHQNLDLSIKLSPKRCSMVFRSAETSSSIGMFLATAVDADDVGFDPDTGEMVAKGPRGTMLSFEPAGGGMYRAVLAAQ